jgi:transcriptional regulator with XRE-family HTH domain
VYLTSDLGKKIGQRVGDLRRGLRLTQSRLAEIVQVKPLTVNRWEHGKAIPSVPKLAEVAAVLGVQVADLLIFDPVDLDAEYEKVMALLDAKTGTKIRRLLRAVEERQGRPGWRHGWS